jgi:hypothetical protein
MVADVEAITQGGGREPQVCHGKQEARCGIQKGVESAATALTATENSAERAHLVKVMLITAGAQAWYPAIATPKVWRCIVTTRVLAAGHHFLSIEARTESGVLWEAKVPPVECNILRGAGLKHKIRVITK